MNEKKRKFRRLAKKIPVEVGRIYWPFREESKEKTTCSNVGRGGLCLAASTPFETNSLVNLNIQLSGWQLHKKAASFFIDLSSDSPLTALGSVVWSKPQENSRYAVGIKFLDICADDIEAFESWLDKAHTI